MVTLTRSELSKKYNITESSWKRRHDDVMDFLSDYMNISERCEKKRFYYDIEGEVPIEIPVIPRKSNKLQKIEDYELYTIAALGTEFKPNSKSHIARNAIEDFGESRYGHTSVEAVARRYVKNVFDEYGETNNKNVWVDYSTYEPLDKEIVDAWREILRKEHISEEEAGNAFYREQQGEDISKERGYYQNALTAFRERYGGITPVLVKEWKCK